jgi:hypothetical protein
MLMPVGLFSPKDCYIIWFSSMLTIGVRDECNSRDATCALNYMHVSTFVLHFDLTTLHRYHKESFHHGIKWYNQTIVGLSKSTSTSKELIVVLR